MLSIKLKTERGTFTVFLYLHSTMLSIKYGNTYERLKNNGIIYIPLCYLLNTLYLSRKGKSGIFTFHYVIY